MRVMLFANTDWYLYNFRLALANSLRSRGDVVFLVSPDGPYGQKFSDFGFAWVVAPMTRRSLNVFKELYLIFWLFLFIKKNKIDCVHGFTVKCAIYGAIAARLGRVSNVSAVAGLGYVFSSADLFARTLRPFVRILFKVALGGSKSRLVLQNPDDVSIFVKNEIVASSRIRLIRGSGVDCSRFSSCPKWGLDSINVLLASRLLWDKGVQQFVDAARVITSMNLPVRFFLAGSVDLGNPNSVGEDDIRSWVEEGVLTWLGHVDDMPNLLAEMNIMILPTVYGEGVPRSLLEGAAARLALITTDSPGCREIVVNNVTGLTVPNYDFMAIVKSIEFLYSNQDRAIDFGNAARMLALSDFDEKIVVDKTLAVYDEVF